MINSVVLFGRLTADPNTKPVGDDKTVTTFRIAVQRPGPKPRDVDFVSIECWNHTAVAAGQYLHKGRNVGVQGVLRQDEWTGRDGQRHDRTYIVAHHIEYADSPPDTGADTSAAADAAAQTAS